MLCNGVLQGLAWFSPVKWRTASSGHVQWGGVKYSKV